MPSSTFSATDCRAAGTGDGVPAAAVSLAQRIVPDVVGRFAPYREFARSPSSACRSCAANGWCDPPDDPIASRRAQIVDGGESAGTESADVVPF